MCSARDLEARLVGTTPDEFLSRPDVEYTLGDDDWTLTDEEGDEVADTLSELEEAVLDRVKQWCFAHGQKPHPLLPVVIGASLEATIQSLPPELDPDDELEALSDEELDEVAQRTDAFISASLQHDPAALQAALDQFGAFVETTRSPSDLFGELGTDAGENPPSP
jgi:hypothetical protein